jgi:hypothetical protein
MATRSTIAKYNADGTITAIYCHYDGYPQHNGRILNEYYASNSGANLLLKLGSFSALYENVDQIKLYNEPAIKYVDFEHWVNAMKSSWCEYGYLWMDSGWLCFDFDDPLLEPLV